MNIKIGPHVYEIELTKDLVHNYKVINFRVDPASSTIHLNEAYRPDYNLFRAVCWIISEQIGFGDVEIDAFSAALFGFLYDNIGLFNYTEKDQVIVAGVGYDIEIVENLTLESSSCSGVCNYAEQVISLNKDLKGSQREETILHECVHAIIEQYLFSEIDVEEFVHRFSNYFYMVIIDNKEYFKDFNLWSAERE